MLRRRTVLAVLFLATASSLALPSAALSTPPPRGWVTYDEGRRLGLPWVEPSVRPEGVPYCPLPALNLDYEGLAEGDVPPDDAPICFARPADLGAVVPRTEPVHYSPTVSDPPSFSYRHVASTTDQYNFEGAQNLVEITDPSVCHLSSCPEQHFYVRLAALTEQANSFEVGWIEAHEAAPKYDSGNRQVVFRVFRASPRAFESISLAAGQTHAFRLRQCGPPGAYDVCVEWWNGTSFVVLDNYTGVMQCETSAGTGKCQVNVSTEAYASDGSSWFAINGGSDGLRVQNYKVRTSANSWYLFDSGLGFSGRFVVNAPYVHCPVYYWYHYRGYYGPTSC